MENKNNIPNNNKENPSFLDQIKKESPFSVPKSYFEVLPQVIIDKKLNNKSIENIFDKLSYRILAPTFAVLAIIAIVYLIPNENSEIELTGDQISEIILNESLHEFDEDLIYSVYSETQIEEPVAEEPNEEIIDYLINNNIDINSIIEEL